MRRDGKRCFRFLKVSIVFLIGFMLMFDFRWRPILVSSAESQANVMIIQSINEQIVRVLQEMEKDQLSFVSMTTDESGCVRSLSVNSVAVDRLKCDFLTQYHDASESVLTFRTTLGTLSGLNFLNGLGPSLTFHAELAHAPDVEIVSSFEEAGINQTIHRVVFRAVVDANFLYPGGGSSQQITTDYLVSETVLLGEVPKTYGSLLLSGKTSIP